MPISRPSTGHTRRSLHSGRLAWCATAIAAVAVAAVAYAAPPAFAGTSVTATAAAQSPQASPNATRKYRATRPLVVDRNTGQRRMPTAEEIQAIVNDLAALAPEPPAAAETLTPSGGVVMDLTGAFGGVVLARPNADGTFETRCVFTFDEGAEFLGLVVDNQ